MCWLDRAMANSSWAEEFSNARSEYLDFEGSGHRQIASHFSYWNETDSSSVEERITDCGKAIIEWKKRSTKTA